MSDGHGSIALPCSYSPRYSPSSPPYVPSSPPQYSAISPIYVSSSPSSNVGTPGRDEVQSAEGPNDLTGRYNSGQSRAAPTEVVSDTGYAIPSRRRPTRLQELLDAPVNTPIQQILRTPVSIPIPTLRRPAPDSCFACDGAMHSQAQCPHNHGLPERTAIPSRVPKRRREASPVPFREISALPVPFSLPRPIPCRPIPVQRSRGVAPAAVNPALAPVPESPIEPHHSYLWKAPIRERSLLDKTVQSAGAVFELSRTYTEMYPPMDPRLKLREWARRRDNHIHSEIEVYYNDDRKAALPKILIVMLAKQVEHEEASHEPHTHLPGTKLYINYLRVLELPPQLHVLHREGVHDHAAWEPFIRIGYKLISYHLESQTIKQLRITAATPLHLQVIPYSQEYRIHQDDLFTRFQAGVRQQIEEVLEGVVLLCKDDALGTRNTRAYAQHYQEQCLIRSKWDSMTCLPSTFIVTSTPSLPLPYPGDVLTGDPLYHPLMHVFEVDFLRNAVRALKHIRPSQRYNELDESVTKFTEMTSPYQTALSRMFLSRIFDQIETIPIFESPYGSDDDDLSSMSRDVETPDGFRSNDSN
ncbi:hypothetical protein B0H11DRAFT_2193184 [Mycena galericulata]|nr:hypothetical protein B0H11DRAFT_2193184 [Mycena galericulata]